MNPKIEKLTKEIEKTRDKIAELQAKQRDLEKQRTELENTDIVALVRSLNLSPEGLAEFIKSQQAGPAARGGSPQGLEDGTHEE
nr:DUF4315 family protein [uncultured Eisenbergiella sp.]